MKSTHAKAIIIKLNNSKDADKLVHLVKRNGEKISVLAKGVRKQSSRKAHTIDLANYVSIHLAEGYQVPILTESKLLDEHIIWKTSFLSLVLLQLICEILYYFAQEGAQNPSFFQITHTVLKTQNESFLKSAFIYFAVNILNESGNLGDFKKSTLTGKDIDLKNAAYVDSLIGLINLEESEFAQKIDSRLVKILQFYKKNTLSDCLKIKLDFADQARLLNLVLDWVELVIEKELKARKLLTSTN